MAASSQVDEEKKRSSANSKKKSGKKGKNRDADDEDEESLGSKLAVFFITLFIIVIWLAIIGVLIKSDVGGFGSSVLYPILKDVPYVNKILPNPHYGEDTEDTQYRFDSIDDAVKRIKELEMELDEAISINSDNADQIASLKQQIEELIVYKQNQVKFELEKEKFYEEVVFSDDAPDIEEYRKYYASIDPENAEILYKQVVGQLVYDEKVKDYAEAYSSMKAKDAAEIFNTMKNNLGLVADILWNMEADARGKILAEMDPEIAAAVTKLMEPKKH